jgi:small GTP-binding protein
MSDSLISYKFILIGNSGVGKTAIFDKLHSGKFIEQTISTIGVAKRNFKISIDVQEKGKNVKKDFDVCLNDTAGQEQFRAITYNYYKGSDGILLIYDITDRESFENVETWINSITESIGNIQESKYAVILIGNKLDLIGKIGKKREVTEDESQDICKKYNLIWGGEQSAKEIKFEEIKNLFNDYVKQIYDRIGEKKTGKQNLKKLKKYKKKSSFNCFK